MREKRKRGYSIQPEGFALIDKKRAEKGYSRDQLAEAAQFSIDTIKRIFRGEKVQ